MSKAFKKLMKQQEEERVAEQLKDVEVDRMQPVKQVKATNMFAGMQMNDTSEESEEEVAATQEQSRAVEVEAPKPGNSEEAKKAKKKAKKNKKKKKAAQSQPDELVAEEDDFIIQEVSDSEPTAPAQAQAEPLLVLNTKNFNYNKELDGYFKGTRLSDKQDVGSHMNKRQRNLMKQALKQNKPNKKYVLAHNEDVIQKLPDKLELKLLRTSPQFRVFGFEPTPKLAALHETYETVRDTADPNAIQDFLMSNAYYPEALYDMAEFFRLKGNYKDANYLMEKLLFFYEECLTFEFKVFEDDGREACVLDPTHNVYTGLFFKAVFKFMVILVKKGCYKAALEYAKLLLKLNPLEDPMGALLMIDHFALSAGRLAFLKDFSERYGALYFNKQTSLLLYPNYIFSYALCLFKLETKDATHEQVGAFSCAIDKNMVTDVFEYRWAAHTGSPHFWLTLAVLLYPQLLKALLNVTEMHKLNPGNSRFVNSQKSTWVQLFEHDVFDKRTADLKYPFLNVTTQADIDGLAKVFEIYPERNKLIWKSNAHNVWAKAVVGNLVDVVEMDKDAFNRFERSLVE